MSPAAVAASSGVTWRDVEARLAALADLLNNLAEPADRGLTDDLWVAPGTFRYLAATVRELAERCLEQSEGAEEAAR